MSTTPYDPTPDETPTIQVATAQQHVQLMPGAILGDRYRIVSLVGRGGMGAVYRADDLRIGQTIALKFLTRGIKHAHLLYEEVRIGRQVSHPNVCRLYDVAEVDGQIFITMELVDGENLSSLLRRVGRLTTVKAMGVARDLCAGLAAAHELGVIHRDLKPGNVMIDGRGRARITDFGLAIAEESADGAVLAGTPAYLPPEQLEGEKPSARGDIYALGLVLYEVFTGKRAIEDGSLPQIIEQHRERRYARPSEHSRGIEPAIERMILRCLDPDPTARPASVAEMVRELPGFDPLAAAVAAGETPTPAMIAASQRKGDLRVPVAWAMFGASIVLSIAVAALSARTTILGASPPKPPEVLHERVEDVLAAAGTTVPHVDRGALFWPGAIDFFYFDRRSPVPMMPYGLQRLIDVDDPPFDIPGMTRVRLDGNGHLLELAVVPPNDGPRVALESLLPFTGLDLGALRSAAPMWTAPVDTDFKRAWLTRDNKRIEAASYRGRPVWFSVAESTHGLSAMEEFALRSFLYVLLVLPLPTLLMTWHNYRRRTGDLKGAIRVASLLFVVFFASFLMRAHHPGAFVPEWTMTLSIMAFASFMSIWIGMFYFAIEPFVRKRWPEMLISWSRLVAGRWRDPMIGRDLLIGCIAGASLMMIGEVFALTQDAKLASAMTALSSSSQWTSYLVRTLGEAVLRALEITTLLLVMRALVRRVEIAVVLCTCAAAATFIAEVRGSLTLSIVYALVVAGVAYALLFRAGLFALIAAMFVMFTLRRLPVTLDPSLWYFGRSLIVLLLIATLAAFGFWRAAGGRRSLRVAVEL